MSDVRLPNGYNYCIKITAGFFVFVTVELHKLWVRSKGVCAGDLLVVNVAYVNNNLVLLQTIEKFNIQRTDTQNVAMKIKDPLRYTIQKYQYCRSLPCVHKGPVFVYAIRNHAEPWLNSLLIPIAK